MPQKTRLEWGTAHFPAPPRFYLRIGFQLKRRPTMHFDDPVVGGGGGADAYAEVEFPIGRDVEVDGGEELLLLVVEAGDVADVAVVGVVLECRR